MNFNNYSLIFPLIASSQTAQFIRGCMQAPRPQHWPSRTYNNDSIDIDSRQKCAKSQKSFKHCNSLSGYFSQNAQHRAVWVGWSRYRHTPAKLPSRQFSRSFKLLSAISSWGAGLAAAVTVLASHKDSSVICRVFRIIICWLSLLMFHKIQTKLYSRFFFSYSGGKILIDPNHRNLQNFPPSGMWSQSQSRGKMLNDIRDLHHIAMITWPVQY